MPHKDSGQLAVPVTVLLLGLASSVTSSSSDVRRGPEWRQSVIASSGRIRLADSQSPMSLVTVVFPSKAQTRRPDAPPAWLAEAEKALAELSQLPDRWGGSEKPSHMAIQVAQALVRSMERQGHRVLGSAPIADGGIALYYVEDRERHARFDIDNDGGILVATRAGSEIPTRYAELPEVEAVAELSRFIQYDDDASSAG